MKRFTSALLSSLQGLTFNPEDQIGKQIMARVINYIFELFEFIFVFVKHLHAVLHEEDDKETAMTMDTKSDTFSSSNNSTKEIITSGKN